MTESDIQTERIKNGCRMFADLSQAQVEYASRIFRGLFILNGGAATAIIATNHDSIPVAACCYGFGALLSIFAFAGGFFTNSSLSETWRPCAEQFNDEKSAEAYIQKYTRQANIRQKITIGLAVLSALTFIAATACVVISPI